MPRSSAIMPAWNRGRENPNAIPLRSISNSKRRPPTSTNSAMVKLSRWPAARRNTVLSSANVTGELRNRLKGSGCTVYDSNLRLQLARKRLYSYGDSVVVCGQPIIVEIAGTGKVCINPRLVVEVLSPSSDDYDRTTKFDLYREIESFQEYVLVSQKSPRVETYYRQSDGGWRIDFAIGLDSEIQLRSVPAKLPLSEIYAGVTFTATETSELHP